jgi:hypothetical protein
MGGNSDSHHIGHALHMPDLLAGYVPGVTRDSVIATGAVVVKEDR